MRPIEPLDLVLHCNVYSRAMEITLQYFDGCPNWTKADELLQVLARENPSLEVRTQRIATPAEADASRFYGSPSFLIDGKPLFELPDSTPGLACRVYQTPSGLAGSPTLEQLRAAIDAAGRFHR